MYFLIDKLNQIIRFKYPNNTLVTEYKRIGRINNEDNGNKNNEIFYI